MLTLAASYQEQKHRSSPELRPRIVSYCSAHSILTSVRKTQSEVTMDKNLPDASTTNRKLVVLSLGLLCILQAALNISLRLALYSSDAPDYDAVIKNLTEERDQLKRKLNTSDSSDAPDYDAVIRNLTEERDQLKRMLKTFDSSDAPDYDAVIRNLKEEGDQLKRMLKTFGWVYFRSSFYFISSDTKSWGDSRDDCLQKGADLVIINSKEENEFTRQFRRSFWIGLTDTETEGTWKWVDGTLLSTSYWHPGEPNSYFSTDEDCGETKFNEVEDNWNDEKCHWRKFWICEKSVA
ncbi:CD209 antigen-like protein B isoform X9 [Pleuronectes platessa]|uniref:CD209 antigen-like protein B isoform X9 n=1 Tax=Pleuronectes platessa TaxID=8262 RepID=UPI00232A474F|nr:CD209 antigen-like protein B isoform X9 [Pleuronectes platessa]